MLTSSQIKDENVLKISVMYDPSEYYFVLAYLVGVLKLFGGL